MRPKGGRCRAPRRTDGAIPCPARSG
jgi:hypothetical protein